MQIIHHETDPAGQQAASSCLTEHENRALSAAFMALERTSVERFEWLLWLAYGDDWKARRDAMLRANLIRLPRDRDETGEVTDAGRAFAERALAAA